MTEVIGKCGISAKIVLDSVSAVSGDRLTTMEITYPRFILAEFNTHRMLSRNSASSRAIPFAKMRDNLTALPVRFGQANRGMQDKGEDFEALINGFTADEQWDTARYDALEYAEKFYKAGYHKQVYNRLTEPFQLMKTVVSATEWANFLWLRYDEAADPSINELARCMKEALEQSVPNVLQAGEYHLPYVETQTATNGEKIYIIEFPENGADPVCVTLDEAIKVSCARACAVSFRNTDYGLEKSCEVYERLVSDSKIHGSALEHTAKVMKQTENMTACGGSCHGWGTYEWEDGVSHMDSSGSLWSANFKGFIQHRKTIAGECYKGEQDVS